MALGTCRHCGKGGIATDAPVCGWCGGWSPKPGLFTKLGVQMFRIVMLAIVAIGLLFCASGLNGYLIGLWMGGLTLMIGGTGLLRSLVYPYG